MPINGQTALVGVIGLSVRHSLSPAMHNAAAAALGLNLAYVPLSVTSTELAAAVSGLRALGFLGANVTMPHKEAVVPLLDEVDEAAWVIGAVNTIAVRAGRLWGTNTDWSGFLADLQALGVDVAGKRALVLGAGGAARAVVYALATAGATVTVLARHLPPAEQMAAALQPHLPAGAPILCRPLDRAAAETAADLIVNTTPLGMTPDVHGCPWPDGVPLPAGAFVYDVVYTPPRTRLLQMAAAAGQAYANGLGMLLRQGAQAFQLWTGRAPDLAVMAAAAAAEIEQERHRAEVENLAAKGG